MCLYVDMVYTSGFQVSLYFGETRENQEFTPFPFQYKSKMRDPTKSS